MKQASTLDLNNIIQYLDSSELVFFLATKDTEQKQLLTFFVNMFRVVMIIFELPIIMELLLELVSF